MDERIVIASVFIVISLIIWWLVHGYTNYVLIKSNKVKAKANEKEMNTKQSQEGEFINNSFEGYRIGDIWRVGFDAQPFANEKGHTTAIWHTKMFPDSIAGKYLQCTKFFDRRNVPCMVEVMDKVCPEKLSKLQNAKDIEMKNSTLQVKDFLDSNGKMVPNSAVVHLRIGDVVGNAQYYMSNVTTALGNDVYKDVCKQMKKDGIEKALFVGGIHKTKNAVGGEVKQDESKEYVEKVLQMCKEEGIETAVTSNDPDTDLCIFSNADYFVSQPKSGFSQIASAVVRKNNKKVVPATLEKIRRKDAPLDSEKNEIEWIKRVALVFIIIGIIQLMLYFYRIKRKTPFTMVHTHNKSWTKFFAIVFISGVILSYLVPLMLARSDKDYTNFFGATLSRRLDDTDFMLTGAALALFTVGGLAWVRFAFDDDQRLVALIWFIAATYLIIKVSFWSMTVHSIASMTWAVLIVMLMLTATPCVGFKVIFLVVLPLPLLWILNKILLGWKTTEDSQLPAILHFLYYAAHIWYAVGFIIWILWATWSRKVQSGGCSIRHAGPFGKPHKTELTAIKTLGGGTTKIYKKKYKTYR